MSLRDLPKLRQIITIPDSPDSKKNPEATAFYDVKFYPYLDPDEDHAIFAVTGRTHTIVYRCDLTKEPPVREIRWFQDDACEDEPLNSLAWSRTQNHGTALLCVSGKKRLIDVLNPVTGECVQTLDGSGADVNDLATCPTDPSILASASMDRSVKLWTLDPAFKKNPMAAICHGEGHQEGVVGITWHRKGEYILSGGMDTKVNLWHIAPFKKSELGTDKPRHIHYPHFSSTEVHSDYPDCLQFLGDLIISRCPKENRILAWRIDGFNSHAEAPAAPVPPSQVVRSKTGVVIPLSQRCGTWSAWSDKGRFQRLLAFRLDHSESWYIRFNLFHEADMPPICVAGNHEGVLSFWDLQELEDYPFSAAQARAKTSNDDTGNKFTLTSRPKNGNISAGDDSDDGYTTTGAKSSKRKGRKRQKKVEAIPPQILGDPLLLLEAHKQIALPKPASIIRQVAWSKDGRICVAVGDRGMIAILTRWEDGIPEA